MDGKNETLDAILAEMCSRILGEDRIKYMLSADEALAFADCIKAAYKREIDEARKARDEAYETAEDALWELAELRERAPGNAAAMREVIEDASDIIRCYDMAESDGSFANQSEEARDWFAKAAAALAEPARNCDVGTAREQIERFNDFCRAAGSCPGCPLYQNLNNYERHGFGRNECMAFWGQLPFAPAEGGAK